MSKLKTVLRLLGVKGCLIFIGALSLIVYGVSAYMPHSTAVPKVWAQLPGSTAGAGLPASPTGAPGDFFGDIHAQLPPGYTNKVRRSALTDLNKEAWDDEHSRAPTNEYGAPIFIPSEEALNEPSIFTQQLAQHHENQKKFFADRTQAISAALRREIADIEANIATARQLGNRTNDELAEAMAAVTELKKAQAGLGAELQAEKSTPKTNTGKEPAAKFNNQD